MQENANLYDDQESVIHLPSELYISAIKCARITGEITTFLFFVITGMIIFNWIGYGGYFLVIVLSLVTRIIYLFGQRPGTLPPTIKRVERYYKNHLVHRKNKNSPDKG